MSVSARRSSLPRKRMQREAEISLDRVASRSHDIPLSRRRFLASTAALGGGLVLSLSLPFGQSEAAGFRGLCTERLHPHRRRRPGGSDHALCRDGAGHLYVDPDADSGRARSEPEQLRLEHAPPNEKLYANPLLGVQATGNSNAMRGGWKPLREAGATARIMLVAAAAQRWSVDPKSAARRRARSSMKRQHGA